MDIYQTSVNPLQTQENQVLPLEGQTTSDFVGLRQGAKYKLLRQRLHNLTPDSYVFRHKSREGFINLDPFREPGLSMSPVLEDAQLFRQQKLYQYIAWTLLAVTILLVILRKTS